LYPIASRTVNTKNPGIKSEVPLLLYFGFCGGGYRKMLNALMLACSEQNVKLQVTGPGYDSLEGEYENVTKTGFVGEEGFGSLFESADILLVLLNFEPGNKKHFSTHFPSKLVEYCGKGKLIGIWGPSYSTAVEWAKETGAAFYFTENDAGSFLRELLNVFGNSAMWNSYIERATKVFDMELSPELIHDKFKREISNVLRVQ
jgi:hypothetical protein